MEQLTGGKEIIRIAHRDLKTEEPKTYHDMITSLRQLLKDQSLEEIGIPGWMMKVYKKLSENELSEKQADWLLKASASSEANDFKEKSGEVNVESPDLYDNIKVKAEEVLRLLENSLNAKDVDSDSKWFRLIRFSLEVQILQSKLGEILLKLQFLLTKKPRDWRENYVNYLSKVKSIIEKVSKSIKLLDKEANSGEADCDSKTELIKNFTKEMKHELEDFQVALRHMDHFAKLLLVNDDNSGKNDDIILVDETKNKKGSEVNSNKKDEL